MQSTATTVPAAGARTSTGQDNGTSKSSTKFERIQILRFWAALAVILFHALGTGQHYFAGMSRFQSFSYGDLGVDIFFGISGFIIFIAADARERNWSFFLRRRLERLVPLYWIATLAMAALLAVPGPSRTAPPDLTYLATSLFYVSWAIDRLPIVYPGWTLECEMVFYAIVTVALAIAAPTWRIVLIVLGTSALIGTFAAATWPDYRPVEIVANPMYLEFALGVVAAHIVLRRPLPLIACVPCVLALVMMLVRVDPKPVWRVLAAGVPGALLVLLAASRDLKRGAVATFLRPLVALGDASYSIYLVQAFVISIACKILHRIWSGMPVDLAILILTITTLGAAWIVHLFVERPIRRGLRRLEPKRG